MPTSLNDLAIQMTRNSNFVMPKKDKLLCWIVSNTGSKGAPDRIKYYNHLKKYIHVHLFGKISGGTP